VSFSSLDYFEGSLGFACIPENGCYLRSLLKYLRRTFPAKVNYWFWYNFQRRIPNLHAISDQRLFSEWENSKLYFVWSQALLYFYEKVKMQSGFACTCLKIGAKTTAQGPLARTASRLSLLRETIRKFVQVGVGWTNWRMASQTPFYNFLLPLKDTSTINYSDDKFIVYKNWQEQPTRIWNFVIDTLRKCFKKNLFLKNTKIKAKKINDGYFLLVKLKEFVTLHLRSKALQFNLRSHSDLHWNTRVRAYNWKRPPLSRNLASCLARCRLSVD